MSESDIAIVLIIGGTIIGSIIGSLYFGGRGKPLHLDPIENNDDKEFCANDPTCPWGNIVPYIENRERMWKDD